MVGLCTSGIDNLCGPTDGPKRNQFFKCNNDIAIERYQKDSCVNIPQTSITDSVNCPQDMVVVGRAVSNDGSPVTLEDKDYPSYIKCCKIRENPKTLAYQTVQPYEVPITGDYTSDLV